MIVCQRANNLGKEFRVVDSLMQELKLASLGEGFQSIRREKLELHDRKLEDEAGTIYLYSTVLHMHRRWAERLHHPSTVGVVVSCSLTLRLDCRSHPSGFI